MQVSTKKPFFSITEEQELWRLSKLTNEALSFVRIVQLLPQCIDPFSANHRARNQNSGAEGNNGQYQLRF